MIIVCSCHKISNSLRGGYLKKSSAKSAPPKQNTFKQSALTGKQPLIIHLPYTFKHLRNNHNNHKISKNEIYN